MQLYYFCLLAAGLASCEGISSWDLYVREAAYADQICHADQIGFQAVTENVVSCVRRCAETPGCRSLVYLHDNKTCFGIKSHNPFSTSLPLSGAVFYRPGSSSQVTTSSTTIESTSGGAVGSTTVTTVSTTPATTTTTTTTFTTTIDPGTPMVIGVANSQLTASSFHSAPGYTASDAKLNNTVTCWCVEEGNTNTEQYIQVDFLYQVQATHVITKGDPGYQEWVTSYKVFTSTDCVSFVAIQDGLGNDMIFTGNVDNDSEFKNVIDPPVVCRCFRINPRAWVGNISIRFEVLGHVV